MTLMSNIVRRGYSVSTDSKTRMVVNSVAVVRPARVVAKNRDGLSTLQDLGGTCPARSSNIQQEAIGEVVLNPSTNFQQRGGTGLGSTVFPTAGVAFLERQEPRIMERGVTTEVTYFGGGFTQFLTLEYLLPRSLWASSVVPETHPGVVISNLVIVSSSLAESDVEIDVDAIWELDEEGEPVFGPVEFNFV